MIMLGAIFVSDSGSNPRAITTPIRIIFFAVNAVD
jgi:hypothetical protein